MEILISWCNENQGFVSALLALSSVFVAIIALFISIKTSKKQNKIQIDLQARQLRLDTFQFNYDCWKNYEPLYSVMVEIYNVCKKLEDDKKEALIKSYKIFINHNYDKNKFEEVIHKSKFIYNKYTQLQISNLLYSLEEFCVDIRKLQNLVTNPEQYDENDNYFYKENFKNIKSGSYTIYIELKKILDVLESNLSLYNIIPNNKSFGEIRI